MKSDSQWNPVYKAFHAIARRHSDESMAQVRALVEENACLFSKETMYHLHYALKRLDTTSAMACGHAQPLPNEEAVI